MLFPDYRPRRLRQTEAFRRMIRETRLSADDFILPLFAIDGQSVKKPIDAMPGHFQMSLDYLVETAAAACDLGIPAIMSVLHTSGCRCSRSWKSCASRPSSCGRRFTAKVI